MGAQIYEKIRSYNGTFDRERIKSAFAFAEKLCKEQGRSIECPLYALDILMPLKPDENSIIAVLFKDLYINANLSDETVEKLFGNDVLNILQNLNKLSNLNYVENDEEAKAEIFRKMFVTLAKDVRVILIWLVFRICRFAEMSKNGDEMGKIMAVKNAESLCIPLASRLGIYRIKTQFEDFVFKFSHPKEYEDINNQILKFTKKRKNLIEIIKEKIEIFLKDKGIKAEVSGRIKSAYSIYRKLTEKGLNSIEEVYDFFAMRIVLPNKINSVDKLYMVLGLIHSEWKPLSARFRDYIAVPKPNGYKSLHTVVLGISPKDIDQPVEIQIRDAKMHREAELGVASHWIYKSKSVSKEELDSQIDWIRGLEKVQEFFKSQSEMLTNVDVDIFKDRIFVLTPRGEVKDLPVGSVPIDFAYTIHTNIGHRCVMAKVNESAVPLDYELKNGDVVEIITKKGSVPRLRWLSLVKTGAAKNKIKAWFSSLNKENHVREGRQLINAQLERLKKPVLDQNYSILKNYCGQNLSLFQREHLVEEVGKGEQKATDLVRKIYPYEKELSSKMIQSRAEPNINRTEEDIIIGGEEGLPIKIALCCNPNKGDKIKGYVTRGNRISIHKNGCHMLEQLDRERFIPANWKGFPETPERSKYRVGIKLTTVSRVGLIHDVSRILKEMDINIVDVMIRPASAGLYYDCFLLDLDDLDKFDVLMDKLENIEGVQKVARDDDFR